MIVDLIVSLISALLTPIFAALPSGSLNTWFPLSTSAQSLGHAVYLGDAFLPLHEIVGVLHGVFAILVPAVVVYKVANWVYKHIPQLGGFGPGSG